MARFTGSCTAPARYGWRPSIDSGMGFHASIAAVKGAIEGLARSLAAELAVKRVRVNAVAPSLTDTPSEE